MKGVYYRRRLPHWFPPGALVFVTFRLSGSIAGSPSGPVWLQNSRIANVVTEALLYGESTRRSYRLHAWVVMPTHVHVIFEPLTEMSNIMRWLKGTTGLRANRILGRTGMPFWREESFDHWIRSGVELTDLVRYVEENPVKAGLAEAAGRWEWSSASRQTTKSDRPPH